MTRRRRPVPIIVAFVVDALLVVGFAATGRASHDSDVLAGLWTTAWPFLAALVAGWLVSRAWRAPAAPWRTGIPVWAVTFAGGMLLRALVGQGTAFAFILVAGGTLAFVLIGWRALVALVRYAVARRQAVGS
ncbi:DUF3054 domain-containing protein [Microbacterium sp. NPDC089189]|uniref:DUF3054 domain-containing protein n=1 Tax=Microbacterium sp. NPDC089189 TaxID=3154972 RepID=UPI003434E8D8